MTMASVVNYVVDFYTDIMENKSDPRVKDWPLMSGPGPTLLICLTYAFIVKVVGPKFMEKRKPYQLRKTLIVYNLIQVILSAWLFYESIIAGWFTTYSFRCQPVDYSNTPKALRTAGGCWWYFFSKFTEFFDTFFFVLRKKNDQVSKLHVIHHGVMPLSTWFGVKFSPGGHSTFFGMLNTFVHIVMYSYYLLAALGPHMQKYLWWKKYLTALQMVQFVLVMLHAFQLLFIDCNYPKAFVWWIGLHAVMFYFLFADFYKQAYKKRDEKIKAQLKKNEDAAVQNGRTNGYANGHANGAANGKVFSSNEAYQQPDKKMESSYISQESLRNRAFINKEKASTSAS
ncbi:elongation of very long chain fatty acids protein-like [Homalodisca vitripennis]|uniref:elongation of very long chain fatty acids protein-like n=1 Tax=Homalodisca vitripennis TaxID=197043 RepID=UPI001EEB7410|nr:elongation of very long chain fatty acids protein-like [Homalodisca vitripennis]XP_046670102.1 elongation of very long chain fatty acids protein-like [Homalodisca vitripennis]XP_046670110.1 elongation of very long chain fatty acids protein-like [Homalodisca vitripennis]XP_046670118.1 elongation of very long chain fatty acids protein-like [Homalodisca vitripennis]XP_046670127.1 elongation of very long chain fatty acids protein-like [Homalodisca vitripennis]XP_046670136.1 elongation of very l